ncbi:Lipid A 3-O-deacylase (PagL) [Aquiflexum balticum DSM 16537]|uniref:Lipid A 3-O-deacylase (PagL) n=1 Tax=Aquiflexum balticum DSM 16537 TaxID=758820 RepID=A0A1W2H619_9BACT|nr:acyloxyacyl hydrolase [Aquiflexum balticum]SMD44224.1 Lipid A 3-O-deacylase (PagL) [Aquiflexum balticum DSM 16537]
MEKHFFGILLLLICSGVMAQTNKRLSLEGQYGFIIPHSSELKEISQSNPFGVNVHYQTMNLGKNRWDACNCFHYLGVQLSYHNFANRDVIGSAYSLSGTFEPILWKNEKLAFSILSGIGVSYLDRVYDEISNPENIFFSSPISFILFVTPKIEYRISENWSSQLTVAYNHISNGGQSQPNKGINYPMLGIGVNRYFQSSPFPKYEKSDLPKTIQWFVETAFTTRESDWSNGRKPVLSLVGGFHKNLTAINALGAGLELTKDYALDVENSRLEALMPAPFIAHHFLFGRIDFNQRFAIYTQKPTGYNDYLFYQRYSLMYRLVNDFSMGFSLKAHGHVAENMDVRISFRF